MYAFRMIGWRRNCWVLGAASLVFLIACGSHSSEESEASGTSKEASTIETNSDETYDASPSSDSMIEDTDTAANSTQDEDEEDSDPETPFTSHLRARFVDSEGDPVFPAHVFVVPIDQGFHFDTGTNEKGELILKSNDHVSEGIPLPSGEYYYKARYTGDQKTLSVIRGYFEIKDGQTEVNLGTLTLPVLPDVTPLDKDEVREFQLEGGLSMTITESEMDWEYWPVDPAFSGATVSLDALQESDKTINGKPTIAAWAFAPYGIPTLDGKSIPFAIDDDLGLAEGDAVSAYQISDSYLATEQGSLQVVGTGKVQDGRIAFDGGMTWITWLLIVKD